MKKCTKCGIEKDEMEFYADKKRLGGLSSLCKQCTKDNVKKWAKDNPDRRKIIANNWYKKHGKNYYDKNKKRLNARIRRDRKINPEKYRIWGQTKRSKTKWKEYNKEYSKMWAQKNKEWIREYRALNKDYIKKRTKEYQNKNKDKIQKARKIYRQNNRDKIKGFMDYWRNKNANKIKSYGKEYRNKNIHEIAERQKKYAQELKRGYVVKALRLAGFTENEIKNMPFLLDKKKLDILIYRSKKLLKNKS